MAKSNTKPVAKNKGEDSTQQESRKKKPEERNPKGKGGFGDHPEHRNPGGWKPENTISYQYRRFMNMPEEKMMELVKKEKEAKSWTVAMDLAFRRVVAAQKSLPDVKEITDRTEGKAPQYIEQKTDVTSNGEAVADKSTVDALIEIYKDGLSAKIRNS